MASDIIVNIHNNVWTTIYISKIAFAQWQTCDIMYFIQLPLFNDYYTKLDQII